MEYQLISDSDSDEDNEMDVYQPPRHIQNPERGQFAVDVITDSEDESFIDSEHSDNSNYDEIPYDPDSDYEEDEADDDEAINFNPNRPTFSLDLEAPAFAGNREALERFLLIVAKSLRFNESYKSMLSSFKIENTRNANFPEDMKTFWTFVNRNLHDFTNVVTCTVCWTRIGEKRVVIDCICGECGPNRINSQLGTFLYISMQSQISSLFNKEGIAAELSYPWTRQKQNVDAIEDVYDCLLYRQHSEPGGFLHRNMHNYSFAIWADSVSPIKSSNVHLTPIFFQVSFKHVIIIIRFNLYIFKWSNINPLILQRTLDKRFLKFNISFNYKCKKLLK